MKLVFHGVNVYTGQGFERMDVRIRDGVIADVSPSESLSELNSVYIFPGFADVHVHLREPGFSYKEDIATGSRAAAAGGYTDVCAMPNLNPVPDCREHLEEELEAIRQKAVVRVHPYGSLSVSENGLEIADLDAMACGEVVTDKVGADTSVVAFSDDGKGLASDDIMRDAMLKSKALGRLIAAHCEDMTVIGGAHVHDGVMAKKLGIRGITSESEWKMIARDIELAKETGCPYHVCHVSTEKSVDIIRKAKAEGVDITCETGPHYLLLCEDDIAREYDRLIGAGMTSDEAQKRLGRFKMNPPLRSQSDRDALVAGFMDGTIDMLATDHAPHALEEKQKGILGGPMGVAGLECAFPVMYTGLVRTGQMSLEQLVRKMTDVPRERFGLVRTGDAPGRNGDAPECACAGSNGDAPECAGFLRVGQKADLCVYDLDAEYKIDPETFATKGRFTPFEGMKVRGRCLMTLCDGRSVYDSSNGIFNE